MDGFKKVTSRENPLIKLVSSLQKSAAARRENGLFVLEGLRLCTDACDNGIRFDKLIVSFSAAERYAEKIAAFAKTRFGSYGGYAQQYLFFYGKTVRIGTQNQKIKKV